MTNKIDLNLEELNTELQYFCTYFIAWLSNIRELPVIPPQLEKLYSDFQEFALLNQGFGLKNTVHEFIEKIVPGFANTAGPRAFPWVIGGVTPAAFIGALYQIMYGQINMVSGASIAPKLEMKTIKLLLDLFNLSREPFEGILTIGTTASNIVALAFARQKLGEQLGINISQVRMRNLPEFAIFSACPHVSTNKALENLLRNSIAKAKIVIASAATVNAADFDNFKEVSMLCRQYNAWLHVDGAFGLFARCVESYFSLTVGIEYAHSITADAHKWLNVPYDCGILFIRKKYKHALISSFSTASNYISTDLDEPMNKGLENFRALRALPVWMSLKTYSRYGYAELIKRNCNFAKQAASLITNNLDYGLLAPVRLNVVLFRGKGIKHNIDNLALLKKINETGEIFITGTTYKNLPALRIAVCNWQTTRENNLAAIEDGLSQGIRAYKQQYSISMEK